jgi:hypothetical protein
LKLALDYKLNPPDKFYSEMMDLLNEVIEVRIFPFVSKGCLTKTIRRRLTNNEDLFVHIVLDSDHRSYFI